MRPDGAPSDRRRDHSRFRIIAGLLGTAVVIAVGAVIGWWQTAHRPTTGTGRSEAAELAALVTVRRRPAPGGAGDEAWRATCRAETPPDGSQPGRFTISMDLDRRRPRRRSGPPRRPRHGIPSSTGRLLGEWSPSSSTSPEPPTRSTGPARCLAARCGSCPLRRRVERRAARAALPAPAGAVPPAGQLEALHVDLAKVASTRCTLRRWRSSTESSC